MKIGGICGIESCCWLASPPWASRCPPGRGPPGHVVILQPTPAECRADMYMLNKTTCRIKPGHVSLTNQLPNNTSTRSAACHLSSCLFVVAAHHTTTPWPDHPTRLTARVLSPQATPAVPPPRRPRGAPQNPQRRERERASPRSEPAALHGASVATLLSPPVSTLTWLADD